MNLSFNVHELKETSILYNEKIKENNEFIIVGEEKLSDDYDCYKAHQLGEDGLCFLGGLNIDEFSLLIPKNDLQSKRDSISSSLYEIDIPKNYLTIEIIENIKRLNS